MENKTKSDRTTRIVYVPVVPVENLNLLEVFRKTNPSPQNVGVLLPFTGYVPWNTRNILVER